MNKKGLIGKLKRGINTVFAAGALGLASLVGCKDGTGPDLAPQIVEHNFNPSSGIGPIQSTYVFKCEDPEGKAVIHRADLNNDGFYEIEQNSPVNITNMYNQTTTARAECSDGTNMVNGGARTITILPRNIYQNLNLINDIDITRSVTLENIPQATLKTVRNDSILESRIISSPYADRLEDSRKGNYLSIVEVDGLKPDTARITVPNYMPTITGMATVTLPEGDTTTVNLNQPTDRNFEDNPVPYDTATSRRNKVTPTLNGNQLHLKADSLGAGADTIDVRFGSSTGGFGNTIIPVNIQNRLDISGRLEDLRTPMDANGNKTGSQGTVAIYTITPQDTFLLRKDTTNADGDFKLRLDSVIPGESVYLQARLNNGAFGPDSNFVRTIVLPNRDTTGLIVRAYPYDTVLSNNGILRNDIRAHLRELNPGYFKWNLDSLVGVDIDPLGDFTLTERDSIEKTFRQNLSCYTGGRLNENYSKIQQNNPTPYLNNERNWIYIIKNNSVDRGLTSVFDDNGVIYKAIIELDSITDKFVKSHEQGHSLITQNNKHAETLSIDQTIMRGDVQSSLNTPGPADCEAGRIIYEETFRPREGAPTPYDRLIGLGFFRQYNQ